VSSKNYPKSYGADESCTITIRQDVTPSLQKPFDIYASDHLRVKGKLVQRRAQLPQRINADETITWKTRYDGKKGWQLCFSEAPITTTKPPTTTDPNAECSYKLYKRSRVCDPYGCSERPCLNYHRSISLKKCAQIAETDGKKYFSYYPSASFCYMPKGNAYDTCVTNPMSQYGINVYELDCIPSVESDTAWTMQSTIKAIMPFTKLLALVGVASIIAHLYTRSKSYVPITAEDEI